MTAFPHLFTPLALGSITAPNRIFMAPMTRSRARPDDLVTELHSLYYQQRATAGLIISEVVHPSADGKGYNRTPGLFTQAHATAYLQANWPVTVIAFNYCRHSFPWNDTSDFNCLTHMVAANDASHVRIYG